MLREAVAHADWCEMTMSMMREKQFEACERRLFEHPGVSLFGDEATDADAQALYAHSFDGARTHGGCLVTLASLRELVWSRLELEALYLSEDERRLVERMLLGDGETELGDWDNLAAAEALVSRLWCGFRSDDDVWILSLPTPLHEPLSRALRAPEAAGIAEALERFDSSIRGLLYISGLLHSSQPQAFFVQDVIKRGDELAHEIARRYLQASFEYIADAHGDFILLHPGLADPYRLVSQQMPERGFTLELPPEVIAGGVRGILEEEEPLHEALCAALYGNLRPDYDLGECAEDLRMLAKQGVPYDEMEGVMSSMLAVMPTRRMKDALWSLYLNTPRWMSMKAAVAN